MHAGGQELDEVEQALVGPVDVLEDEHRRPFAGNGLDEGAHGEEERLTVRYRRLRIETEQDRQVLGDRLRSSVTEQGRGRRLEFLEGDVDGVALEDVAELLELEAERAVRRALAIRKRASPYDTPAELFDDVRELEREPRLADAGRPDDGHQVGRLLVRDALPDPAEDSELGLPADHCCADDRSLVRGQCSHRDPGLDDSRLALGEDWIGGLVDDCVAGARVGLGADEDAVRRRVLLESRGRVHHIAGDHCLAELGVRTERDERLAGIHGNPEPEVDVGLAVQLRHALAHRHRRAHGTLGVVAECRRRTEHAHDRVADELLDDPAERLDLAANAVVVRAQDRADLLRVEALRSRGEALEVDEDDAHHAPLLLGNRCSRRQLGAARQAELGDRRVLLIALRADAHGQSVRRSPEDRISNSGDSARRGSAVRPLVSPFPEPIAADQAARQDLTDAHDVSARRADEPAGRKRPGRPELDEPFLHTTRW